MNCSVKVVPNGVNTSQFRIYDYMSSQMYFEKTYGVVLGSTNIIYVGRLSPEKGVKYLIGALKYLDNNVRLFIFGDGPEKKQLLSQVNDFGLNAQVFFMGKTNHDSLPHILNSMDVFVLPSIGMEGFSNSMLEAMACGLPIVTTTVGAGPEVITEDVGFIASIKNSEQIAEGIKRCLDLDRNAIRTYIESSFSMNVVAQYVYNMYSDLCGKEVDSICYCSLFSPPYELSGAGRQVHELSKELSKLCDVSVISTGMGNYSDGQLDGVNYYRVRYVSGESLSRFTYTTLGSIKGLSLNNFDVVDGRNWEGGLISIFLSKYKGNKSVISFRGEGALEGPWIKNQINKYISKKVNMMTATDKKTAYRAEKIICSYKGDH